ncbi:SIS domain-containing protein [Pseudotabrizicola alkalilacus]|uniref:SIS domain-containing protein n=1 Tax=Pseudotabrizicola alkalilacus TaxID=2305252 RepID=A0A411YX05_9RHOB|nr:SIS domain-containing protein [Pseudotabrizicola alkalilacus]RGP35265.1 SIS domain-containing protein [Pseudotabrizicola alkalilacus]
MLNFDKDRFIRIQNGAVSISEMARPLVRRLLDQGIERVYFMGTGGVQLLVLPALDLIQRHSTFPVAACYPAQVVVDPPAGLDEKALVIIPSLSGTTRESVELMAFLKARSVTTLTLTGHADTPLARDASHTFTNFAEDDTSSESFYLQTLILALALLAETGALPDHDAIMGELKTLPALLVAAKEAYEPKAAALAEAIQNEPWHIFTGAGSVWPEANYYGMCILEEMQWIRTRPVHAADFFHGTLELVEPGVSVFLFKGEDALRPLADRVERFARRYTDKLWVLDAADVALPGVSRRVRTMISPILLATLLERLSAHLEVLRDHPLTTRRYYKRVEY